MRVSEVAIRNFRRLEDISFEIDEAETVFVGPNNSGKTSATVAFRCFLGRREFSVHDFSVARIQEMRRLGETGGAGETPFPRIELDLWFEVDPGSIAYARAFALLPRLSADIDRLGLGLTFEVKDAVELLDDFNSSVPVDGGARTKTLPQFLELDGNLKRHFQLRYYSLTESATEIPRDEAKALLRTLLRVDFIDAQRMIDDAEHSRSNRLSEAFADFYRRNLEQADARAEAASVIDENNRQLTEHYSKQFAPLISTIRGLGVPSINDREIRLVSSLSPETALRGNTDLLYVDTGRNHELPELYNGLGFKNLIYMAVQARDFQSQWIRTAEDRPLCQLLFIEEPEVHLHAQVQQVFIANIRRVLDDFANEANEPTLVPQIVITTHSSHILDTVDFAKVRYFRRCALAGEIGTPSVLNASDVASLKSFRPEGDRVSGTQDAASAEALEFLKRYMQLTHCDLFFADAAMLVEGAAERLLISAMVAKAAPGLKSSYICILEVGGSHANRFEGLLAFLRIPYLVITDLDSVASTGNHEACRGDTAQAITSNPTLKKLLGTSSVAELLKMKPSDKEDRNKDRFVAFPTGVSVNQDGASVEMIPRTLEEAIAYQNFALLRNESIPLGIPIPQGMGDAYEMIYTRIKSDAFKKTDFALNMLAGPQDWVPPEYISEGLHWLERRLCGEPADVQTKGVGSGR